MKSIRSVEIGNAIPLKNNATNSVLFFRNLCILLSFFFRLITESCKILTLGALNINSLTSIDFYWVFFLIKIYFKQGEGVNTASSYYKQENIYDITCVFDLGKSTGNYLSLQTV